MINKISKISFHERKNQISFSLNITLLTYSSISTMYISSLEPLEEIRIELEPFIVGLRGGGSESVQEYLYLI